eukprot:PITA_09295
MEHLLQKVSGAKVMSFLDGFSGFNQIVVHANDQEKTAFTTPWGTFMYAKMPFGLMNAGASFQRAMDIAFVGEKDKFVVVYLDDITIYSKNHQDHLQHLKKVFLKCRRFGISVNPKKSQFSLEEGKMLGHVSTAELVKHITSMLKKGSEIKWTEIARKSFDSIKKSIMESPTLISPDYSKEFHIFSFASTDTLLAILLQVDEAGSEHPVAFFSNTLRDAKLNYDSIEKQAYALIKSLKDLRVYILHSKIIAYVPSAAIKDVLTQHDADGRRAKWIEKLIEFNIELKPTKLVRGQGLTRLLAEENCKTLDMNLMCLNSEKGQIEEEEVVEPEKKQCQRFEGKQLLKSLPLKPIHAKGPFQQWGLDFIGEVNPHSSGQHRWILVATNYFIKWIEAIPTRKADHNVVMKFLIENIFTRFGCPHKLITDNATTFREKELVDMCNSMGIKLVHSTSYYPQGNGLAESSNKSLIRIIKKLLDDNKKNWDSKLKFALWVDRVTIKRSTGNSPFKLVYGTKALFPIQLILPVAKFLQQEQNEEEDMAKRITNLAEVHQIREELVERVAAHQKKIKEAF